MNFAPDDVAEGIFKDRAKIGASLADIDPMNIDRSVSSYSHSLLDFMSSLARIRRCCRSRSTELAV